MTIKLARKHELKEEIQVVRTVHHREKSEHVYMEYSRLLPEINRAVSLIHHIKNKNALLSCLPSAYSLPPFFQKFPNEYCILASPLTYSLSFEWVIHIFLCRGAGER